MAIYKNTNSINKGDKMFKKTILAIVNCCLLSALSISMVFAGPKTYQWTENSQPFTIVVNWDELKGQHGDVTEEFKINETIDKFYRENIRLLDQAQEMSTTSVSGLPVIDNNKISRWLKEQLQVRTDITNFLGKALQGKLGGTNDDTTSDEALAVEIYLFAHGITHQAPPVSFIDKMQPRLNNKAVEIHGDNNQDLQVFLRGFIQALTGKLQPIEEFTQSPAFGSKTRQDSQDFRGQTPMTMGGAFGASDRVRTRGYEDDGYSSGEEMAHKNIKQGEKYLRAKDEIRQLRSELQAKFSEEEELREQLSFMQERSRQLSDERDQQIQEKEALLKNFETIKGLYENSKQQVESLTKQLEGSTLLR